MCTTRAEVFSCILLLILSAKIISTQEEMNEMFERAAASPVDEGSGEGSTPYDLIPGCLVPDLVELSGTTSLIVAFNQAACHSICLDPISTISMDIREMFTGYPVWTQAYTAFFFSEDGIDGTNCLVDDNPYDCQVPNPGADPSLCPDGFIPLLNCKRGCMTELTGYQGICSEQCVNDCMDTCITEFLDLCVAEGVPLPCQADCDKDECEDGCNRGNNFINSTSPYDDLKDVIGVSLQPSLPPNITSLGDTLYWVDVEMAVPTVDSSSVVLLNQVVPYSTVILRVSVDMEEKFYVLDESNEVDLGDFACRAVSASFAVVTDTYGMSDFSPPLSLDVLNIVEVPAVNYTSQVTNIQTTVESDERAGFFLQHIIHVSWTLPIDYQFATGYILTLASPLAFCGALFADPLIVNLDSGNVNEYTFQTSDPPGTGVVPPFTSCKYSLSIEAVPRNPEDDLPSEFVSTGDYNSPNSSDITLTCNKTSFIAIRGTYNISIHVHLSDAFTPAVLAAINLFQFNRLEVDLDGNVIPGGEGNMFQLVHINETVIETSTFDEAPPLEPGRQYCYEISVSFIADLPTLPPDSHNPGGHIIQLEPIEAYCLVRTLPVAPNPVNMSSIFISHFQTEALNVGLFRVTADYGFTYEEVQESGSELVDHYELWWNSTRAPEEGDFRDGLAQIGAIERQGTVTYTMRMDRNVDFDMYLQIRIQTDNTVSLWSEPLITLIEIATTGPGTPTDADFNITGFTFSTGDVNDFGELEVTLLIDFTHQIIRSSNILGFDICVDFEEIPADSNDITKCLTSRSFDGLNSSLSLATILFSPRVQLPRLGILLFLQVRMSNPAQIPGSWSRPEIVGVDDIPFPTHISPSLLSLTPVPDDSTGTQFSLDMFVTWAPGEGEGEEQRKKRQEDLPIVRPELMVTQYTVVVGDEEITEPYDPIPFSSVQRNINVGGSLRVQISEGNVTLDNEPENTTAIILYVQMRSVAGDASGSWSEAVAIIANVTIPEPRGNLPLVLGTSIPFAILAAVLLFCIIFVIAFLITRQYRLYKSVKSDGVEGKRFDLWRENYTEHFIPEGLVEGKELVVDEWEIPTSDIIVENHLGEGAFGLVFKGTISAPLRNPKLSAKLRHIGLPVAVKLLKETASNKERKDFWTEIDMMKKISEGYCNHIVNMVGCVTLQEPLCLITEFVPHGDLLEYLRSQRKKNASRNREKQLVMKLEQQRKAYEEVKLRMEILQSAQSTNQGTGEGHPTAGASGYADFLSVEREGGDADAISANRSTGTPLSLPSDESPTAALIPQRVSSSPYASVQAAGSVATPVVAGGAREEGEGEGEEEREKGTEEEKRGKEVEGGEEVGERVQYEASGPAPYLEPDLKYSLLEPSPVVPQAERAVPLQEEVLAAPDDQEGLGDLETNDLMQFAYQIATGMEYLSSINIVHRDLACRNILVGEGKNLKITDFGLSREVEDVYVKTTKGRLPLKWMALESIEAREFTTASDVWSYGVVLWEIGTLGGFPYPTIQNQNLLSMLKQGYQLEKPDNCRPEVYDIMLECWHEHTQDRPTFPQLREKFSNLLLATTGDAYMELEVDNSKIYYTVEEEEQEEEEDKTGERIRKDSESSADSKDSATIRKQKMIIEKPKWAQRTANPYVHTPSATKNGQSVEDDGQFQYRVAADVEDLTEVVVEGRAESSAAVGSPTCADVSEKPVGTPPLTTSLTASLSTKPTMEDSLGQGVPLSLMMDDKPPQPAAAAARKSTKRTKPNPYVDDLTRKRLLADDDVVSLESLGKTDSFIKEVATSLTHAESMTSL